MSADPTLADLVAKIGSSAVVVDDARQVPEGVARCWGCREAIVGDSVPVKEKYTEVDRPWHPACWERYKADREERKRAARQQQIDDCVRRLENRFNSYINGMPAGDAVICQPPRFEFARFDNVEFLRRASRRILAAAEKFDPRRLRSMVLASPTGSAKTASMLAWLWRHRDQQIAKVRAGDLDATVRSFVFATGPELAVARRNAPLGDEAPLIRHAMDCSILIMDELGFEKLSEVPFEIVDHRYRTQDVTVVTTGLRATEFRARYGDAMFRRLTESGALVEDFPVAD